MVKIRRFICEANIPNISKISFSWYQLSNYHLEKVPDINLMCPIVIQKPSQSIKVMKNIFRIKQNISKTLEKV